MTKSIVFWVALLAINYRQVCGQVSQRTRFLNNDAKEVFLQSNNKENSLLQFDRSENKIGFLQQSENEKQESRFQFTNDENRAIEAIKEIYFPYEYLSVSKREAAKRKSEERLLQLMLLVEEGNAEAKRDLKTLQTWGKDGAMKFIEELREPWDKDVERRREMNKELREMMNRIEAVEIPERNRPIEAVMELKGCPESSAARAISELKKRVNMGEPGMLELLVALQGFGKDGAKAYKEEMDKLKAKEEADKLKDEKDKELTISDKLKLIKHDDLDRMMIKVLDLSERSRRAYWAERWGATEEEINRILYD